MIASKVQTLSKRIARLAGFGAALACASGVLAQSFNIDIGGAAGAANPPPFPCFGADVSPGVWNNWNSTTLALDNLLTLDGSVSNVNLTRSSGVGGNFGSGANAGNTGHWFRLLNDAQDVGGAGASRTYTFNGLEAGTYDVYTYAIAPDSDALFTNVDVPASGQPVQVVGGAMPGDMAVLGVTHAHHTVNLGPGDSLTIIVSTHTMFGSINGIQLVRQGDPPVTPICAEGSADPAILTLGESTELTVSVTPAANSTGIVVEADLTAIGGPASQAFDHQGDDVYTLTATVMSGVGLVDIPFTVEDDQNNFFTGTITLTIPAVLTPVDGVYEEISPNHTKSLANMVPGMTSGESITGTTLGLTGEHPDYFLVRTAPMPLGIYKHRLMLTTSGTAGHTGTIRGVSQIAAPPDTLPGIPWDGVIGSSNPDSDVVRQTSQATAGGGVPERTVQWYGFGMEEQLYYRVHGTASTTEPYFATLETTEVMATDIGTFAPGLITMNWNDQGHTTDTTMWVYDAEFNAIPGYGNDDSSATLAGAPIPATSLRSWLAREYAPGTYYIALSNWRASNDQPAASDDNYRTGALMDFPGSWLTTSSTTDNDMTFTIEDSDGQSLQVVNSKPERFGSNFFKFTVGVACPADLTGSGSVGVPDLLALLAAWGPCPAPCPADLTGNGNVGVPDLLSLLSQWGPCP